MSDYLCKNCALPMKLTKAKGWQHYDLTECAAPELEDDDTPSDWIGFAGCKTCGAESGEPCISTWLRTTKGRDVIESRPHPKRPAVPVSSVAQKETK